MIVYFTGTGNSRYAAEYLAKQLNDELLDAGRSIKAGKCDSLHSERPWIFAAPVYAWRMANVMADYIRSTCFRGNGDAYFVLTCGSEIGQAGKYLARLCEEKGLNYKGVLGVEMPENYIALFNAPGEEEARAIVSKAKPVLRQGGEFIMQGKDFPTPKVGLLDRIKAVLLMKAFISFTLRQMPFATNDCTGCGRCVEACPLNNILLRDEKPVWAKNCTHCMACICGCPAHAIEYGKRSRGKPRYQCPKDEEV